MANASVEKLKSFGLRQGEKFVVGIAAAVLLVAVGVLATSQTIAFTPAELQKKSEDADSNLRRKQDAEAIATKVAEAGIVDPGFVKIVANQEANTLKPDDYRARQDWVTPEPGAGLIRDQPELIAPTELLAFPGRGGALLYVLDADGKRIPDPTKQAAGGFPGMLGAAPKAEDPAKPGETADQKRRRSLAGSTDVAKTKKEDTKDAEPDEPAAPQGPFKEDTIGKRWVVVTGVVDNELLNKNWLAAVKNPATAYPQYVRADVERQTEKDDGSWTEWALLDWESKFDKVLDQMPEADEELVPLTMRPENLVDPLPFLRAGYWTGVHVARLVPADLRSTPTPDQNPFLTRGSGRRGKGRNMGMSMSGMGPGMGSEGMGMNMGPGSPGMSMNSGGMSMTGGGMSGGESGMMMSGGGMSMSGGLDGGQPEEPVVANIEPTLMIRSLDFTVEPNSTYRYRVRLVVKNPNFERTDVNPGTDTTNRLLFGAWSETTSPVSVPSDVSIYTQFAGKDVRRDDVVNFQVIRWDPAKGQTVIKTDEAAPGFLIGEYGNVLYPSSEGTGPESKLIDFNSRSFVLDAVGGDLQIPDLGLERNKFTVPAMALVVEPDGGVVLRTQSRDTANEVRKDMDTNYQQALDDSKQKREPSNGSGMMQSGPGGGR